MHFFTIVIVPEGPSNDVLKKVEELMDPFYEGLQVEPYEAKCWCVGKAAWDEVRDQVEKLVDEELGPPVPFDLDNPGAIWVYMDKRSERRDQLLWQLIDQHPLKEAPNPTCRYCQGTGKVVSTYNPNSKWDWWRIGGRYDGRVRDLDVVSEDNGFNFGEQHETLELNTAPVSLILEKDVVSYAVLTPDGQWYERWDNRYCLDKPIEMWRNEFRSILERYKDGYVGVGVDCHI